MKKAFSIILAGFLLVLLASCGEKLTLDNYYDFIYVHASIVNEDIYDNHNSGVSGVVEVKGLSDRYDFSNISLIVTVSVETKYDEEINKENVENKVYSVDVPVELNVAGDGTAEYNIEFISYFEATNDSTMTPLAKEKPGQYSIYFPRVVEGACEVKSIKGRMR